MNSVKYTLAACEFKMTQLSEIVMVHMKGRREQMRV